MVYFMHILLIIRAAKTNAPHTETLKHWNSEPRDTPRVHSGYFTDSKTDTFETILHVLHLAPERDAACSPQSVGTSRAEWKERFPAHGGGARQSGYLVEKRK